ncbi:MAG TPA: outer membrane beta-barrel protein [Niabella sp.]|nr:outer membrane beta-barrel protein [Niabella sp.]
MNISAQLRRKACYGLNHHFKQLMRIIFIIIAGTLTFMQALMATSAHGQLSVDKIEVRATNTERNLLSLIQNIEAQTAFHFYYRKSEIKDITIPVFSESSIKLSELLKQALKHSGFFYRQIENSILIERNTALLSWSVTGRVLAKNGNPISFATVNLLTSENRPVQATLADSIGRFIFSVFEKGNYFLKVFAVGYDSTIVKLNIVDTVNILVPDIYLPPLANEMQGITVVARKQIITQQIDGITYDMQADPDSKANSVFDMLRKVPYISVDGNNNILLRGSSGYRIFINGRPSGLVERNPQDVLRSIPASTIKSIQIITNPPAKYDAEGVAGIINIITLKQIASGYQGSVNAYWKGPGAGPGIGGSFAIKEGKLGASFFTGGNFNRIPELSNTSLRTGGAAMNETLKQNGFQKSNNRTGYMGIELSYELDSLSLLTGQFNMNGNRKKDNRKINALFTDNEGMEQGYDFKNEKVIAGDGLDASLNYQLGFSKDKNEALTFSYRYMQFGNDLHSINIFENEVNFNQPDFLQTNNERFREHTVQVDFSKTFGAIITDIGSKAILRKNGSNFKNLLDAGNGDFVNDPLSSNQYDNNQNVYSFYNSYSYKSDKWEMRAGGRAEQTVMKGNFSNGTMLVKQNYLNVVPNVAVKKKFNSNTGLTLSYAIRIQRPAIGQLNPFVDRSTPGIVSSGNPSLRPIISPAWYLTFTKIRETIFEVAVGYLRFNKSIYQNYFYNEADSIVTLQYLNTGKGQVCRTGIFIRYPFKKWWSLTGNSDVRYITFEAITNNKTVKINGWMGYLNLSNSFSLKNNWRISADITTSSSGPSGMQSRANGYFFYTAGLSKSLLNDKMTISFSAGNITKKYRRLEQEINGIGFHQQDISNTLYRNFSINLNYRFGKLNSEIKKNKKGINNDDIVK